MRPRSVGWALALGLSLAACSAKPPPIGGTGSGTGGTTGGQPPPPAPVLDALPAATPELTARVSGTVQEGTDVVITGGAQALTVAVFPNGSFCGDVPLIPMANNQLQAIALYQGLVSSPATAAITQDPTAAQPNPATCSNEPIVDAGVDCTNPIAAVCAYACNSCVADAYAPNSDPQSAPAVSPGVYQLQICPCHDDWFALVAPQGALIDAQLQTQPTTQLAMQLARPLGIDGGGTVIAQVVSDGGLAELIYGSDVTEVYDLRIFAQPDAGGSFQLTLNNFTLVVDAGSPPPPDAGPPDAGQADAGPPAYGPCTQGPGLDPAECQNSLTPYCDINRMPPQCVFGPNDTRGETCNAQIANADAQCNFGLPGTEVVCSSNSQTCVFGYCHSNSDCPVDAGLICDDGAGGTFMCR